jgi:predicted HicB family RNase H-like nuclease
MSEKELTEKQRAAAERRFISKANKETPTKRHSIILRISPHQHEQLQYVASLMGQSVNAACIEVIWAGMREKLGDFGER